MSSCEVCFCSCEVDRIVFYSGFSIWGAMCAPHVRSSGQQQVKVALVKSSILMFLTCNINDDNSLSWIYYTIILVIFCQTVGKCVLSYGVQMVHPILICRPILDFFLKRQFFFFGLLRLFFYASTSGMCPEMIPGSSEYWTINFNFAHFFLFLYIFFLFLDIFLEFWTFFSGNFGQYRHSPHNCDILNVRSIIAPL